ncbi:amidase [Jeotgalibacillus haloalkalitolerans]|uniref:Amidase n=1 Tax=Jeotgalibacillus haloalkalitolerans TaxID=3104292 RepID=A0ABU5KHZ8_9BACL|nr:amidase [Jeotgalibacillus sp. HH7-29]MDZ5710857.1 amidase [Jeotgalibacillus sp. HH7-29]
MKKVICSALLCLIVGMVCSMAMPVKASTIEKATWLWNPWSLIDGTTETLDFLSEKQVTKVYVQIDRDVSADVYRSFIKGATARGIDVYALDGAPDWAAPKGYLQLRQLLGWVEQYQQASANESDFKGIHLDVEPYLYSGWNSKRVTVVKAYQSLIKEASVKAVQLNIRMEADVPFWFDEIKFKNTYGSGLLSDWVQQHTDGITIMAYRDSAAAITPIVLHELAVGDQLGKPVVIGVETGQTSEGEYLTFIQEGEAVMNSELEKVVQQVKSFQSFNGFAIHHTESWKALKP